MDKLIASVISGNHKQAVEESSRLLAGGRSPEDIVLHGLMPAMQSLDDKCSVEMFNLLEIMLAGRCVLQVMDLLVRERPGDRSEVRGTAVLGTIAGDVHNLGKNIVKAVFVGSGYDVIDMGTGVAPKTFVDKALEKNAELILVSSLLTTTLPIIREIRRLLPETSGTLIVAGGAAVEQTDAKDLNVDYTSLSVFDGLRFCNDRFGVPI